MMLGRVGRGQAHGRMHIHENLPEYHFHIIHSIIIVKQDLVEPLEVSQGSFASCVALLSKFFDWKCQHLHQSSTSVMGRATGCASGLTHDLKVLEA